MIRKSFLIYLIFATTSVFGQNNFRISQFNFAQAFFNPSMLCFDAPIMVDMFGRNQWLGFGGGPTTFGLSGQYEIDQDMAVGLTSFHDRIGIAQKTSVQGQFAYRIPFNYINVLSLGVGVGIDQSVNDFASVTVIDQGDAAFSQSLSKVFFNAGFGASFATPDFYVGVGIPQLFQNNTLNYESNFNPRMWHYYVSGGAFFGDKETYVFNPHIALKVVKNAPFQADLILRNTFQNRYSFVLGYRTENAIIAGFDITIANRFRVGYSANYNIGRLSNFMALSNEVYIGIGLPYHRDRDEFFYRKYVNNKGGFRRRYRNTYRQKHGIH